VKTELEPLVAIVERIKQDNVEVVWMEGGYTKAWRVVKQLDPKNHRKKFDWKDITPKSSIILFEFKLTSTEKRFASGRGIDAKYFLL